MSNTTTILSVLRCALTVGSIACATSLHAAVPFEHVDGFESGTLSEKGLSSQGASTFYWKNSVRTEVSAEKAKSGNFSLKFTFPATEDGKDSWSEQRFAIPLGASELTVSYDLFVPANFTHRKQAEGINNKFLFFWSGKYGTRGSDQAVSFEYWPAYIKGGEAGTSVLSHHLGPGHTDWGHKIPTNEPVFSTEDKGKWVNFDIYIKLATAPDLDDGVITVKKNGEVFFDVKNLKNYSDIGNFFDQGYLLGWSNSGFAENTVFYLDNFSLKVVSQDVSPPNPPFLSAPQ